MQATVRRIAELARAGLTGRMVMLDFLQRRIAPLTYSARPSWEYSGPNDNMRLERGEAKSLDEGALKMMMKLLTGHDDIISGIFLAGVVALGDDEGIRTSVLEMQPRYDACLLYTSPSPRA